MNNKALKLLALYWMVLMVIGTIVGCAAFGVKSPQEKAIAYMSFYNAQYADYMFQAQRPMLNEEQKIILRKKKEVLTRLYKATMLYNTIMTGASDIDIKSEVSIKLENKIIELSNQLIREAFKEIKE